VSQFRQLATAPLKRRRVKALPRTAEWGHAPVPVVLFGAVVEFACPARSRKESIMGAVAFVAPFLPGKVDWAGIDRVDRSRIGLSGRLEGSRPVALRVARILE
jgi:hypothetical protein